MFRGHLLSTERNTSTKNARDTTGKVNLGVGGGEIKSNEETQEILKEVVDPHDRVTTEVLSFLSEGGYLGEDISAAAHGSLVVVRGTVTFVEATILEFAGVALDALSDAEKRKPKPQQDQDVIKTNEMIKKMLPKMVFPSAFMLQLDPYSQVVGTLKVNGLQEPISSYYFKHGSRGLSDIYMIGIKEEAAPAGSVALGGFIAVAQQAAQAFSSMMFPEDAYRVTPLALFRKIL